MHSLAVGASVCVSTGYFTSCVSKINHLTEIVNFVFALPAVYTIDTFGRRKLLLTTFPAMAACLLITGMGFYIDPENKNARIGSTCFLSQTKLQRHDC